MILHLFKLRVLGFDNDQFVIAPSIEEAIKAQKDYFVERRIMSNPTVSSAEMAVPSGCLIAPVPTKDGHAIKNYTFSSIDKFLGFREDGEDEEEEPS